MFKALIIEDARARLAASAMSTDVQFCSVALMWII
jgi:hypothetical protein